MTLLHKLAHYFNRYKGDIISWREGEHIIIAFQCSTCGKIDPLTSKISLNSKDPDYVESDSNY